MVDSFLLCWKCGCWFSQNWRPTHSWQSKLSQVPDLWRTREKVSTVLTSGKLVLHLLPQTKHHKGKPDISVGLPQTGCYSSSSLPQCLWSDDDQTHGKDIVQATTTTMSHTTKQQHNVQVQNKPNFHRWGLTLTTGGVICIRWSHPYGINSLVTQKKADLSPDRPHWGVQIWRSKAADVPAHCRGGWTRWPLKVPSNPNHSTILWYMDTFLQTSSNSTCSRNIQYRGGRQGLFKVYSKLRLPPALCQYV